MWKKFYSNSGLVLLAVLAAGIWLHNLRSLYPTQPGNSGNQFDAVLASPTPTPQLSCVELYLQRRDQEFLQNCDIVERVGIYRRQPKMVRFIVAAAGHSTEEARLLSLQRSRRLRKSAEEILGIAPQTAEDRLRIWRQEQAARQAGATAICADGTYSYSANRRGTCSHHGGVAQWLR